MKYLIIGGTGTLGSCLISKLYGPENEITCLSRDELKQQELKRKFPNVKCVLGDIRDTSSLKGVFDRIDTVFLVAALKHVDVIEANPVEAIKTNILGTINVANECVSAGVKYLVFSSTDKAVLPINVYGMTKGISERYLYNFNASQSVTRAAIFRWGNVLGSRGSVIHSFAESLKLNGLVNITHDAMTRFWIHIEDAVDFMLTNYVSAPTDRALIPAMKAASILEIAEATASALGISTFDTAYSGIRPGEKIHECLESNHDFCLRSDTADKFTQQELVDMIGRVLGGVVKKTVNSRVKGRNGQALRGNLASSWG